MTPIPITRKPSDQTCDRTNQKRNKAAKQLVNLLSGGTESGVVKQTTALIKSLDYEERQNIMKELGSQAVVPANHIAAMKANLNLPWYQLRQISRWLKTFDIKMSSEKEARKIGKNWEGDGLQVEMAPLTTGGSNKRVEISEKPWAYLYNVVAHVLCQLKNLNAIGKLIQHKFIPGSEVHIKIGGDHGDDSFKMGYQVANVENPNRSSNTVTFSFFYAKDTRANLKTCLSRFTPQINMLQKVKFEDRLIRVFMYGDYEFLSVMYGITGANGKFYFIYFQGGNLCSQRH